MSQAAHMRDARGVRRLPPRLTPAAGNPARGGAGALLEQIRTGHAQAWEMLVRRHGGPLLAVARCLLPSEADARDAVQDAFLAASLSIHRFEGDEALSTWLYRIGVNAVLMKLRAAPGQPEAPIDNLLRAFLDRLPLPYRVVLVLREIGRVSTGEIAAILDIAEPAVRVRLHRARLALRTLLAPVAGAAKEREPESGGSR